MSKSPISSAHNLASSLEANIFSFRPWLVLFNERFHIQLADVARNGRVHSAHAHLFTVQRTTQTMMDQMQADTAR